jgi:hypothetical protein
MKEQGKLGRMGKLGEIEGWGFYLPWETRIFSSTRDEVFNLYFLINIVIFGDFNYFKSLQMTNDK